MKVFLLMKNFYFITFGQFSDSLLENMAQDFIDYDEYVQMCQQQNVPDELSQHTLIDFLHDLGIVLNFREDKLRPQLCDTNRLVPK